MNINGVQVASATFVGCAVTYQGSTATITCTGGGGGGGGAGFFFQNAATGISTVAVSGDIQWITSGSSVTFRVDLSTPNGRLNALDASTATLTTRLNNLDSSTATITTAINSTAALETTHYGNLNTSTAGLTTRLNNLDSSTSTLTTAINSTAALETTHYASLNTSTAAAFTAINSSAAKETTDFNALSISTRNLQVTGNNTNYILVSSGPESGQTLSIDSGTFKNGMTVSKGSATVNQGLVIVAGSAGGVQFADGTVQKTAASGTGGGGDNLGTGIATNTVNMATFPIVNVSSMTFNGTGQNWLFQSTSSLNNQQWNVGMASVTLSTTNWNLTTNAAFASNIISVTTGTSNLFEVNGTSVVVRVPIFQGGTQMTVPDYVFDNDYELRSIPDLERFLKDFKHLPNVPDGDDIDSRNMSQMNNLILDLLRTVEEQSLYIVQLDKRMKGLENKK